jgi:hypothetical protein
MTTHLSQPEFQRLVSVIQSLPEFGSQADRRTLIIVAFGTALPRYMQNCTLYSRMFSYIYNSTRIDLSGTLSKLVDAL